MSFGISEGCLCPEPLARHRETTKHPSVAAAPAQSDHEGLITKNRVVSCFYSTPEKASG